MNTCPCRESDPGRPTHNTVTIPAKLPQLQLLRVSKDKKDGQARSTHG